MDRASDLQFDAYVMVDWSANNSPKTGKDSVWYCALERIQGATRITAIENPATRSLAHRQISEMLNALARRGCATLVGFDFPYGFPGGFAHALNISSGDPWREVWNVLSSRIVDTEQNRSNRFIVAAELNAAISGRPFPFWGCPSNQQQRHLTSTRGVRHSPEEIPEFRFTDKRVRGPQPVWKLCYPGSVGSQALVGIPYVARLRFDPELTSISRVWPFETGFELASRSDRPGPSCTPRFIPRSTPGDRNRGNVKTKPRFADWRSTLLRMTNLANSAIYSNPQAASQRTS